MNPCYSLLVGCLALVLAGCFSESEPKKEGDLEAWYEYAFGERPPEGVTNIRVKNVFIRDSSGTWIRFNATPEIVDSLLRKGFSADRAAIFAQGGEGANVPSWWTPQRDHLTKFYGTDRWRTKFQRAEAGLAHDEGKHVVYFCLSENS